VQVLTRAFDKSEGFKTQAVLPERMLIQSEVVERVKAAGTMSGTMTFRIDRHKLAGFGLYGESFAAFVINGPLRLEATHKVRVHWIRDCVHYTVASEYTWYDMIDWNSAEEIRERQNTWKYFFMGTEGLLDIVFDKMLSAYYFVKIVYPNSYSTRLDLADFRPDPE
jgi:hypothetical protein